VVKKGEAFPLSLQKYGKAGIGIGKIREWGSNPPLSQNMEIVVFGVITIMIYKSNIGATER